MEPTSPAPKSIGELLRAAESRPIAIAAPPIEDRPPIRRERSQGRYGPDVRSAWVLFAGLVLFSLAILAASFIVADAVADLDAGTPATVGPDA